MKSLKSAYVFIQIGDRISSRTEVYLEALREVGKEIIVLRTARLFSVDTLRLVNFVRNNSSCCYVITASSQVMTLVISILTWKRPILDAGWPLSDGVINSRREFGVLGINYAKFYLIDLLAFHFASIVILESNEQLMFVRKKFLVRQEKLFVLYTGLNEDRFGIISRKEFRDAPTYSDRLQVLFRGGNQSEAGLEVLRRAITCSLFTKDIHFLILTKDRNFELDSENVEVIYDRVSSKELEDIYKSSHIVLGQMSNHERLSRTFPHKFFEAAYFGRAYISASIGPMEEFVRRGLIEGFIPGNHVDLALKINRLSKDPYKLEEFGVNIRNWYLKEASQKVLGKKFIRIVSCGD